MELDEKNSFCDLKFTDDEIYFIKELLFDNLFELVDTFNCNGDILKLKDIHIIISLYLRNLDKFEEEENSDES